MTSNNVRKKESILAYGSRGIDPIVVWKTWRGGRSRTLARHILSTQKVESAKRKWKDAMGPHRDKLSKTALPKGSMTSSHSICNRGPSVQIYEHMGNVSRSIAIRLSCLRI